MTDHAADEQLADEATLRALTKALPPSLVAFLRGPAALRLTSKDRG